MKQLKTLIDDNLLKNDFYDEYKILFLHGKLEQEE
jgi:hypothetical protein